MLDANAKLEIMELFSKYLMYLDEKKFDTVSFAEIFTENAEVIIPSKGKLERVCKGIKEIRDNHAVLFMEVKFSHHFSGDFIFTCNSETSAEVRCNLAGFYRSFNGDHEATISTGIVNFSAINKSDSWRIQSMKRKTKSVYNLDINTQNQEIFTL